MEHMAKHIFRETAEKDGLTEREAAAAVKSKASELPKWEEYEDHSAAKEGPV